ncbi:hypothetical protein FEM33_17485 [Dyadobacter flavalbus]|uniref:Uncharacterized protein n=1 Tax=Dyadobacter flavalbus TaxID=2579942 RepID=A0A5M8QQX4_9BACT|nr:hypothetical protein [Dyadobacter flavalbus]KAA6438479.1 hypothetical protein FEM33_17485 [Dyadobacter flavalbus]
MIRRKASLWKLFCNYDIKIGILRKRLFSYLHNSIFRDSNQDNRPVLGFQPTFRAVNKDIKNHCMLLRRNKILYSTITSHYKHGFDPKSAASALGLIQCKGL